ncbi:hypothetical protein J2Y63_003756 [Shinella sp. BE166]|uniref:phage tail assembly protein n=1 Tax=Shinella sp. BE166 TaxID=3373918 RepID=UPI003EB6AAB7
MTKTVTLSAPVEHNGTTYQTLTFREATVGDMMAAAMFKDDTSQTMAVLASISEVPLPAFKKIKVRDITRIMAEVSDLLGNDAGTTGA